VTIANNTPGQPFTPPAVAAHTADIEVFAVGEPANEPTRQLAENGDLGPLSDLARQRRTPSPDGDVLVQPAGIPVGAVSVSTHL
jgi:hypothetical protein